MKVEKLNDNSVQIEFSGTEMAQRAINAATGEVLTRKQSTGLFPASLGRWEEGGRDRARGIYRWIG